MTLEEELTQVQTEASEHWDKYQELVMKEKLLHKAIQDQCKHEIELVDQYDDDFHIIGRKTVYCYTCRICQKEWDILDRGDKHAKFLEEYGNMIVEEEVFLRSDKPERI